MRERVRSSDESPEGRRARRSRQPNEPAAIAVFEAGRAFSRLFYGISAALTLALLMPPSGLAAQGGASELRVAVMVVPPFVMEENGKLTGFNIDLWNSIAAQLEIETNFAVASDGASLIAMMRSQKADVVAAPVVITAARDAEFDFSLPILLTGFQIMVRDTSETGTPNPLEDLLRLLFSKTTLAWLGIALALVLIPAHLVWLLERHHERGIVADKRYFPGVFEAMYWALSCLTTQAETMPRQWLARAFSVFWMFAGVIFVAFYTAQLTTALTVRQIQGAISGPKDLPRKQVGTISNSAAADYLKRLKAQVHEFASLDDMFQALLAKRVDAVVFESPVLRYFAAHEGKGRVKTVGAEFEVAPIAFGFQLDSPLRKRVDGALLTLREHGDYQQAYDKWFGSP